MMELKHAAFSQLFRCCEKSTGPGLFNRESVSKNKASTETYPCYNIDFGKDQWPVTQCMRLMTLREILERIVNTL